MISSLVQREGKWGHWDGKRIDEQVDEFPRSLRSMNVFRLRWLGIECARNDVCMTAYRVVSPGLPYVGLK